MTKTDNFRDVISKMMEAVTLDAKGKLTVINENAMAEADELLNQLVVETARDWWAQLESAEDSLSNMADEISFSELNTDPSHVATPAVRTPKAPSTAAAMESALGTPAFDLRGIFEDEGDDLGPVDGDNDYDDLLRGDDDAGLGDDGPTDDAMDMDGGDDLDVMGDDQSGSFGADDDLGSDTGEFDFSFLDDDGMGDQLGDQGDQLGDLGDDDGMGEFGTDDDLGDQGDELGDQMGDQMGDEDLDSPFPQ